MFNANQEGRDDGGGEEKPQNECIGQIHMVVVSAKDQLSRPSGRPELHERRDEDKALNCRKEKESK